MLCHTLCACLTSPLPSLQLVYGNTTHSNNNDWLRRKLFEGEEWDAECMVNSVRRQGWGFLGLRGSSAACAVSSGHPRHAVPCCACCSHRCSALEGQLQGQVPQARLQGEGQGAAAER